MERGRVSPQSPGATSGGRMGPDPEVLFVTRPRRRPESDRGRQSWITPCPRSRPRTLHQGHPGERDRPPAVCHGGGEHRPRPVEGEFPEAAHDGRSRGGRRRDHDRVEADALARSSQAKGGVTSIGNRPTPPGKSIEFLPPSTLRPRSGGRGNARPTQRRGHGIRLKMKSRLRCRRCVISASSFPVRSGRRRFLR